MRCPMQIRAVCEIRRLWQTKSLQLFAMLSRFSPGRESSFQNGRCLMKSANSPLARSAEIKLMVVRDGMLTHSRLDELASHLEAGDLLVVNDAATVPASLQG